MVVLINTEKLNSYVKRKLMTRKELSEASGVCFGTIAHLWSDPVKPVSHVTVKRLCKALDIVPEDILEE